MRKIIIAIGFIAIIAVIGAPVFNGLMMERIVKQSFNNINRIYADTGSDISVKIIQYDRSYFSSQIEWKIQLGALKAFYGVEEIIFVDRAKHGFTSVVTTTSLEKNKWFTDFVTHKLNGENPLEIQTEYTVFGTIESTLALDAFSFKNESNLVKIMPGTMVVKLDNGLKNIFSDVTWEGCIVPEGIMMDDLAFHSKMERISTYIWDGTVSSSVKNIKVDDGKEEFSLTNLKYDYTLDYNEEELSLSIGMEYGMDTITFGRDFIKNAFARIGINRIDARGYEAFMKRYSQIINDVMGELAVLQDHPDIVRKAVEEQMAAKGFQMLEISEKLLKKGLEIQIAGVRAQLPQGNLKGGVTLSLKKDMTLVQFIPIMLRPAAALDIFLLKSDISLPHELVGDNPWLLTPVYSGMQTGLFIKDGDNLIHAAETRDDNLFLNGKKVLLN